MHDGVFTSDCGVNCTPAAQYDQFTPGNTQHRFANCPDGVPSWCHCEQDVELTDALTARSIRTSPLYFSSTFVPLTRDPRHKTDFARLGSNGPAVLRSQSFDYPFDAGLSGTLGLRLAERLALEGSYLGSYRWSDSAFVRNNDLNNAGGGGVLTSPFTNFGNPETLGLDFNNLVQVDTNASWENAELSLRYRPAMPCGPWDVSFVYGIRYMQIDEFLRYRAEASLPAPLGARNQEEVETSNSLIGAQLGISGHYLYSERCWFDIDLKGGLYSDQARVLTTYENVDSAGVVSTFPHDTRRTDSAFSGDIRLLWNYQLVPHFTVQTGYQVSWVTSVATAVGNFHTDLSTLRGGPAEIRTDDTIAYHGPILGVLWVR
jgi:hypothetical protein